MALSFPLNNTAVDQTDDVFYCKFENYDYGDYSPAPGDPPPPYPPLFDGDRRLPLTADHPAQEGLRDTWVALYAAILAHKNGEGVPFPDCGKGHDHHDPDCAHCKEPEKSDTPESPDTPEDPDGLDIDPVDPRQDCEKANLVVFVKDADGNPVEGALVDVAGLGRKSTGPNGVANFGEVRPGVYDVKAEKPLHAPTRTDPIGPDEEMAVDVPAGQTTLVELEQNCRCWCKDHAKEISVDADGRYGNAFKADGTKHAYPAPVKFKIEVPAKTGSEVTVTLRFKVVKKAGVTDADVTAAKNALASGVATHWDNVFTIKCDDPLAECPDKSFKVRYKIEWVASGQHFVMNVHDTYAREGVTGLVMDVSKTTNAWTYAHEVGHCFGLFDEYSYTTNTETVKFIKPDKTYGPAITAPPNGKPSTDPTATIMAAVNSTVVKERHGWSVAIEVQQLLREKMGRDIVCTVSK